MNISRGLLGMVVLIAICWLLSSNRKAINWRLVGIGLLTQIAIGIMVLYGPGIAQGFEFLAKVFVKVTTFTDEGSDFLFESFVTNQVEIGLVNFAFRILPTIVFFSALSALLYYAGILQKIVWALAWFMKRTMRLSGAESLAAAGNVFLGQTEAPFLVKPFLLKMTKSEMMCLMTGGMATVAGGVLAVYVDFLGDTPEEKIYFAKHLLTASLMSAPAAIVAAKMLVPETEEIDKELKINKERMGVNVLEVISNGTTEGVKLAVNVGAMLLVFTALVYGGNYILGFVGRLGINDWIAANTNYDQLSFQFILGHAFAPMAWILGIDWQDTLWAGQLLGEKTMINELYAYKSFEELKVGMLEGRALGDRSILISTYFLCGFANIASIGIQIGGIGTLVPSRKGLLSKLGFKALIGGTIACFFTAAVVGMIT